MLRKRAKSKRGKTTLLYRPDRCALAARWPGGSPADLYRPQQATTYRPPLPEELRHLVGRERGQRLVAAIPPQAQALPRRGEAADGGGGDAGRAQVRDDRLGRAGRGGDQEGAGGDQAERVEAGVGPERGRLGVDRQRLGVDREAEAGGDRQLAQAGGDAALGRVVQGVDRPAGARDRGVAHHADARLEQERAAAGGEVGAVARGDLPRALAGTQRGPLDRDPLGEEDDVARTG